MQRLILVLVAAAAVGCASGAATSGRPANGGLAYLMDAERAEGICEDAIQQTKPGTKYKQLEDVIGFRMLTMSAVDSFFFEMVNGRGWVCIALVVFGSWRRGKALLGAVLFAAFDALQIRVQQTSLGTQIPYQIFLMMPARLGDDALEQTDLVRQVRQIFRMHCTPKSRRRSRLSTACTILSSSLATTCRSLPTRSIA